LGVYLAGCVISVASIVPLAKWLAAARAPSLGANRARHTRIAAVLIRR